MKDSCDYDSISTQKDSTTVTSTKKATDLGSTEIRISRSTSVSVDSSLTSTGDSSTLESSNIVTIVQDTSTMAQYGAVNSTDSASRNIGHDGSGRRIEHFTLYIK